MQRIPLLLLAMVAALPSLAAQEGPRVVAGSRVRVWATKPPLSGREAIVTAITPESLAVQPTPERTRSARQGARWTIRMPMHNVVRMDVRTGHRPRGRSALRGAGWGALTGLGVGLVAASAFVADARGQGVSGMAFIILPPAGLAAGATIGAAVGAASPGGIWEPVPLPTTGATPRGAEGFRVGLSLRL